MSDMPQTFRTDVRAGKVSVMDFVTPNATNVSSVTCLWTLFDWLVLSFLIRIKFGHNAYNFRRCDLHRHKNLTKI